MEYLLGIDLGTSGTKTVLFDIEGNVIASNAMEYPVYQPKNGWAVQNPDDWWKAVQQTITNVIIISGISPLSIKGIGISGQMHGLVMLDKEGAVLRPSILWCDGRTGEECVQITDVIGAKRLIEISANPALTGFTAGKILWVRKHEKHIYEKCSHILLPKDYIRYKLCNVFASDVSDASGTNLLDVPNRCWSDEILEKLHIDKTLLPDLYESYEVTGEVTAQAAKLTGLCSGIPVVAGAGDNAAAAIGTGVICEGRAFTTLGTSGVIFAHSDKVKIDAEGRVHTFCSAVPNAYTIMSCTLSAGLSLKWFRDTFCHSEIEVARSIGVDPYVLMDKEAKKSPIGANRLIYLPYLMGERSPILDEKARGIFFGLSAMHTKSDMIRAILEGVMYSQKHCLEILNSMGVIPSEMLACGGGAKSPMWRQMMADVYECPVLTIDKQEGPALGAAILAGVGTGVYSNIDEACQKMIHSNTIQEADKQSSEKYNKAYQIYKALYPSLKEHYSLLAEL